MAKSKPEGKKYNYMDTYGDLVTLLLCFFVLLFSMSTVEENKYNAFAEALTERFGSAVVNMANAPVTEGSNTSDEDPTGDTIPENPDMPSDLSQLMSSIEAYTETNNMQNKFSIEANDEGALIYLRTDSDIMFDGDSAEIRQDAMRHLDFIAGVLKENEHLIYRVNFLGHTASVSGNVSNIDSFVLSCERAAKVASYIQKQGQIDRFKILPQGYGRNYPIADNSTPEGRATNRRVDIIIVANDTDNVENLLLESSKIYFPSDEQVNFEGNKDELIDNIVDGIIAKNDNMPIAGKSADIESSLQGGGSG